MTKKDTIVICCSADDFEDQLKKDLASLKATEHKLLTVVPIISKQRTEYEKDRSVVLETEITLCAHYIEVTY